jgi:hypothetical protein
MTRGEEHDELLGQLDERCARAGLDAAVTEEIRLRARQELTELQSRARGISELGGHFRFRRRVKGAGYEVLIEVGSDLREPLWRRLMRRVGL